MQQVIMYTYRPMDYLMLHHLRFSDLRRAVMNLPNVRVTFGKRITMGVNIYSFLL